MDGLKYSSIRGEKRIILRILKEEKRKGKKRPTAPAVSRRSPIQVLGRPDAA